jgi:hypothetical protein
MVCTFPGEPHHRWSMVWAAMFLILFAGGASSRVFGQAPLPTPTVPPPNATPPPSYSPAELDRIVSPIAVMGNHSHWLGYSLSHHQQRAMGTHLGESGRLRSPLCGAAVCSATSRGTAPGQTSDATGTRT